MKTPRVVGVIGGHGLSEEPTRLATWSRSACPVCEAETVDFAARLWLLLGAGARCRNCHAGWKIAAASWVVRLPLYLLIALEAMAVLTLGPGPTVYAVGVVFLAAAPFFMWLAPRAGEPITDRAIRRERRRRAGASDSDRSTESILPHVGWGPVRFGMRRDEVEAALGTASARDRTTIEDWEIWSYRELGLELTFEADADWRCTNLFTEDARFGIAGQRVIGPSIDALRQCAASFELGPVEHEQVPETGEELEFPEADVTIFCQAGRACRLSWNVEIDDADRYVWPE